MMMVGSGPQNNPQAPLAQKSATPHRIALEFKQSDDILCGVSACVFAERLSDNPAT
jgi:hypothetical protein